MRKKRKKNEFDASCPPLREAPLATAPRWPQPHAGMLKMLENNGEK